jgi:hypothetical protein
MTTKSTPQLLAESGLSCLVRPEYELGVLGMALSEQSWQEHSLIYALFLSFALVAGVFFGHNEPPVIS